MFIFSFVATLFLTFNCKQSSKLQVFLKSNKRFNALFMQDYKLLLQVKYKTKWPTHPHIHSLAQFVIIAFDDRRRLYVYVDSFILQSQWLSLLFFFHFAAIAIIFCSCDSFYFLFYNNKKIEAHNTCTSHQTKIFITILFSFFFISLQ